MARNPIPAALLPRVEGTVPLPDGRKLGYAEFGAPSGRLVLWFHGSPGARRQVPPAARRYAEANDLRIVCVERPGVGLSSDHTYKDLRGWAHDIAVVADRVGHDRFAIVALSGGGPYAFACAHELPDRVVALGMLGSLVPTAGDEAAAAGIVALAKTFNPLLTFFRRPLGLGLWSFIRATNPIGERVYQLYMRITTEGDRRVLSDPELQAIFIDDLTRGGTRQFQAMVNDLMLIGRPWGFRLADIKTPVRWWHGDADPFVGLDQAQNAVARLANVELYVRPDESHLGGFAAGDNALVAVSELWN